MKKVLMGNHAAAWGAVLARVQVVAAYPITPATQVVELLAELKASGRYEGSFIAVESEHSAMSALLGASTAGARTFTGTSSQGLAYMHELLHWVSGSRLPVVMVEVNRALAAPWNLWTDQTDSLAQRDTGWIQLYCATNQEVLDTVLMSYKIAEEVRLPVMVTLDGFTLSHTYEAVDVPDQEKVDAFLPPYAPEQRLQTDKPLNFGALAGPKDYFRLRRRMAADMDRAETLIDQVGAEFGRAFGRSYGCLDAYRCDDAETLLVTAGAVGETAREAVDALRARGHRAGVLRLRAFRPFPTKSLRRFLKPGQKLAVVDRSFSPGCGGIWTESLQAALYDWADRPKIQGFVVGLGGGDITPELLQELWLKAHQAEPVAQAWMEERR